MIKSLISANKSEREKFTIPWSVQETIPVKCVYPDGIWLVGNRHSKSWRLTDVNYAAATDEERRGIFLAYGGVLNSLPTDAATKITIINRRLNPVDFERGNFDGGTLGRAGRVPARGQRDPEAPRRRKQ